MLCMRASVPIQIVSLRGSPHESVSARLTLLSTSVERLRHLDPAAFVFRLCSFLLKPLFLFHINSPHLTFRVRGTLADLLQFPSGRQLSKRNSLLKHEQLNVNRKLPQTYRAAPFSRRMIRQMQINGAARVFRGFREVSTECNPMPIVIPTKSRNCSVIR
jgi:hypothetical protein